MISTLTRLIPFLWLNWWTIVGTILTTIAANVFVVFIVVDLTRGLQGRYGAVVAYLLCPFFFVSGLLVIAAGIWRARRRKKHHASHDAISQAMKMVLQDKVARRRVFLVLGLTGLNVVIITIAAYKGVHYTHSTGFCGSLCHEVMGPEYSAYRRSPHSRVPCTDCHVGDGFGANLSSKFSGARQLWGVMTGDFSRPIPTPVHNLRPARETCEKCHWPARFHGERLLVRHHFEEDEQNSRKTNVVQLNVGGRNQRTMKYEGIHWHVSPGIKVTYESLDERRTRIGKITVVEAGKEKRVYLPPAPAGHGKNAPTGQSPRPARVWETRAMDCVDCHNRPTHVFDDAAAAAVDQALSFGKIDVSLPFIRKEGVALLMARGTPRDQAAGIFTERLLSYYRAKHPAVAAGRENAIEKAGRELGWIYRRNIFPAMKLTWNSYPNHIGHKTTSEGCFRCHNDEHQTRQGKRLSQDCDLCHEVLADGEEKPDVPAAVLRLGQIR